jgi:hypothetical protein
VSGDKHPPEENGEVWTIPAPGYVVQMLSIDFRLSLLLKPDFPSEDSVWVAIATPFTYTDPKGNRYPLTLKALGATLGLFSIASEGRLSGSSYGSPMDGSISALPTALELLLRPPTSTRLGTWLDRDH